MKNSVLVSYSRQNRDFVDQFINRLTDEKREVWIDKEDILYTEEWWQAIKRGIEASDIFVTVLSPPYMASPVCNLEMRYARRLNKRFVPILFADINETQQKEDLAKRPLDSFEQSLIAEVPNSHLQAIATENWLHIRKFNWVYIRSARELDAVMPKLNEALDADLGYIQDHTWLLARATTWEAQGLNNSALLRGKELIRAKEWLGKSEGKNPEATALQKDFVDRSVEIEKRNRRVGAAIAAVVVVALVILTTIGVLEGRRATTEERLKVATTERTIAANSYLIGDFEGARDSYKAALEAVRQLEPNTEEWSVFATEDYRSKGVDIANWLANYGQTCAQLRDYDCAEEQLNAAITVDPNGLDPYFLLADVYQVQEEVSSAQDIVQRAGEIYQTLTVPEEEDNFLLLEVRAEGKIAYSDHHYDDVINMFDMQREGFRPDQSGADAGIFSSYFLEMTYYLGRSYEGANEREKACETWQDFVSVAGQAPPTLQLLWMRDMMSYATTANNACK